MATTPIQYLTPEQYLEIERAAEFRHEYLRGDMWAKSGGAWNHACIVGNALVQLLRHLDGRPCEPFAGDLRLCVAEEQFFTYPTSS